MPSSEAQPQLLFQIDCPGRKLGIEDARALLGPLGIEVDPKYRPIPLDKKRHSGRYVVRGTGSPEALARVRELDWVKVFAESRIAHTAR